MPCCACHIFDKCSSYRKLVDCKPFARHIPQVFRCHLETWGQVVLRKRLQSQGGGVGQVGAALHAQDEAFSGGRSGKSCNLEGKVQSQRPVHLKAVHEPQLLQCWLGGDGGGGGHTRAVSSLQELYIHVQASMLQQSKEVVRAVGNEKSENQGPHAGAQGRGQRTFLTIP